MNLAQRIVLILGFLVILSMALFPPWIYVYDAPELKKAERPAGYHLLFTDNTPQDQQQLIWLFKLGPINEENQGYVELRFFAIRIDSARLTIQMVAALILITILYLALRPGDKSRATTS